MKPANQGVHRPGYSNMVHIISGISEKSDFHLVCLVLHDTFSASPQTVSLVILSPTAPRNT